MDMKLFRDRCSDIFLSASVYHQKPNPSFQPFHLSQIFFPVYRYYDPRETKVEVHPWALTKDHSRKVK